jgi:hypothetical protein
VQIKILPMSTFNILKQVRRYQKEQSEAVKKKKTRLYNDQMKKYEKTNEQWSRKENSEN